MQPLHDIRDGARMLRRNPGTSILAAVALALGIGSTTTMYSIVRGVLRDLPVDRPEQLMHIAVTDRTAGDHQYLRVPAADIVALRDQQRSFVAIAAYESRSVHLGDNDHRAQRVAIAAVSPSLFQVLRVAPLVGRALAPDDTRPGSTPVAVLGYTLWRNRYASDRAIVGRTIRIDGVPTSVVGVMREGFGFPQTEQMWTPLAIDTMHAAPGAKDGPAFTVIGRLRDGATRETAGADITALGRRLALADAVAHEGRALSVRPFYDEMVSHKARVIFRSMLLVVSFVLLIACANVANLLLARAVSRSREIAVRLALGASPGALVRQLLVESLAVAIPGGVLGLLPAWAGVTVFNSTLGFELAFWMRVQLDAGVLAFTTGLVVVAAVAAGLAPARQAARVAVGDVLKDRTRGSSSFRLGRASRALVVGEVALSCALLVVTGLMVKGVLTLTSRYVGAAPDHVATGRIELRRDAYPDVAARTRLFDALESRMAAVPGVTSVTLASHLPGNSVGSAPVEIGGVRYERPEDVPQSRVIAIAPTFFQTFGTPLLQGRPFAVGVEPARRRSRSSTARSPSDSWRVIRSGSEFASRLTGNGPRSSASRRCSAR